MERNTLCRCRIVLRDVSPQCHEVGYRLWRPDWVHELLGTGFSVLLPQEATQSLTWSCGIPSPRSSEAMARLIPATCHSLISRYSLMASAARKERLRPVLLANRSSRFLTPVSMRTVKVVDFMIVLVSACVQCNTEARGVQSRPSGPVARRDRGAKQSTRSRSIAVSPA